MRRTTRLQDAQFLARVFADAARAWAPGDACMSFHPGGNPTTVARVEGERVFLADGSSGHRSRMRRPAGGAS